MSICITLHFCCLLTLIIQTMSQNHDNLAIDTKGLFGHRDSYVDAAAEFGYSSAGGNRNPVASQSHDVTSDVIRTAASTSSQFPLTDMGIGYSEPPKAYEYSIYTNPTGSGTFNTYSHQGSSIAVPESGGWLCRTFDGICDENNRQGMESDILGIFGLIAVALKKLKLIKLIPFLPVLLPFLPFILPLLLVFLIPIFVAAWFLPLIPVLVLGRSMSIAVARSVEETLLTDECLLRITCEMTTISRSIGFEAPWINRLLEKASPHSIWAEKIKKAKSDVASTSGQEGCSKLKCTPISAVQRLMKMKLEN